VIHFVLKRGFTHTVDEFLPGWGKPLADRIRVETWEAVLSARRLPRGAWVFGDLDRLTGAETERAARVWQKLERAGPGVRLFNNPLRVKHRYELLRTLHERGLNDFDVYRLTEARTPKRFPVFLRRENDHRGPVGALLHTPEGLRQAVAELEAGGITREGWIAVEFCGEPDAAGVYRKYSAFRMGDRIVPGHLLFGNDWVVKFRHSPELQDTREEEEAFLRANPHADALMEIFRLAALDWGRVDYATAGGRLQVYEINTNPLIVGPKVPDNDEARARKAERVTRILGGLRGMDVPAEAEHPGWVWLAKPGRFRRWTWELRARLRGRR
jgi:hypothetical protein